MKKKIVWLGVSWLIVAALVLTACGPGAPEGEEEEEEEEVVPGEQEEEEEEGVPTLSIGETLQSPEIEVTVSEAIITDSYEYYDETSESMATREASPGTSFLIVTAEIKNTGEVVKYRIGPEQMYASDSEGNEYEAYPSSAKDAMEGVLKEHYDYLLPGKITSGKVVFIIPEGASSLKVFYKQIWPPISLAEWVIE